MYLYTQIMENKVVVVDCCCKKLTFCKKIDAFILIEVLFQSICRGGILGSSFAGYVPLASQNPYPIIVYSVASFRPHLSHFLANVIVISRTEFNARRLLNNKTTAGTIFQPRIFLFLNPCLPEFSYPKNPENLRPHSSNSIKIVNPIIVSPVVKMRPHPVAHSQ